MGWRLFPRAPLRSHVPTYERSVSVDAPFETVWDFHSRISGLGDLTPDWLDLRVEAVRTPDGKPVTGPDGDPVAGPDLAEAAGVLEAGTVVQLSVAPDGVLPRQRWTTRMLAREAGDGAAYVRDEMADGPFAEWVHTHLFYRDGDGTLVRDVVRYGLPGGGIGRRLGPLATVGFEPVFAYRHRRTKALLE